MNRIPSAYRLMKPWVSGSRLLKKIVVGYGQVFHFLPKVLTVSLTYRCPCDCFHCGISDFRKKKEADLSTEEVRRLLDEAAAIRSIVQVTFSGGEPLLRKDLYELIRYSAQHGFFTKIDTNAAFLGREEMAGLKEARLDRIGISIDHHKEEVHDRLRRHSGLFRKVLAAVGLCKEFDISCYLQTYATKQSIHSGDLERTLTLAEELGVDKVKVQAPATLSSLKDRGDVALGHEDFVALAGVIARHKSAYAESEIFSPLEYKKFCRLNFKSNIHVTSYGDVLPCCWLPLSFGNVREKRLSEIVRGMYRSRVFKGLLARDGCLCSDQKFLKEHVGDSGRLPVRINR